MHSNPNHTYVNVSVIVRRLDVLCLRADEVTVQGSDAYGLYLNGALVESITHSHTNIDVSRATSGINLRFSVFP